MPFMTIISIIAHWLHRATLLSVGRDENHWGLFWKLVTKDLLQNYERKFILNKKFTPRQRFIECENKIRIFSDMVSL